MKQDRPVEILTTYPIGGLAGWLNTLTPRSMVNRAYLPNNLPYNLGAMWAWYPELRSEIDQLEAYLLALPLLQKCKCMERGLSVAPKSDGPVAFKNLLKLDRVSHRINVVIEGSAMIEGVQVNPGDCCLIDNVSGINVEILAPSKHLIYQFTPEASVELPWKLFL